jgi:hypothetical protein
MSIKTWSCIRGFGEYVDYRNPAAVCLHDVENWCSCVGIPMNRNEQMKQACLAILDRKVFDKKSNLIV